MIDARPPALGFAVEALLPRARGGGALRMGLSRLEERDWLDPRPGAGRAATFDAFPDSMQMLPFAAAAAREAALLVGGVGDLGAAARAVHEDLCVLVAPAPDEPPVLAAAAVAWPTDWRLADKVGLPLTAVHAPIHGYAEQLAAGVDHFLATLAPGAIWARANWFVVASDAPRYLPADYPATRFAHATAANAGRTLFVRCERQTLRRLPETGAILFTIGVYASPLDALSAGAVARVAAAVATTRAGEHERRAAPHYADALAGYAAHRNLETAA